MTGDLLKCTALATRTIANVSEALAERLGLRPEFRSIVAVGGEDTDRPELRP